MCARSLSLSSDTPTLLLSCSITLLLSHPPTLSLSHPLTRAPRSFVRQELDGDELPEEILEEIEVVRQLAEIEWMDKDRFQLRMEGEEADGGARNEMAELERAVMGVVAGGGEEALVGVVDGVGEEATNPMISINYRRLGEDEKVRGAFISRLSSLVSHLTLIDTRPGRVVFGFVRAARAGGGAYLYDDGGRPEDDRGAVRIVARLAGGRSGGPSAASVSTSPSRGC